MKFVLKFIFGVTTYLCSSLLFTMKDPIVLGFIFPTNISEDEYNFLYFSFSLISGGTLKVFFQEILVEILGRQSRIIGEFNVSGGL